MSEIVIWGEVLFCIDFCMDFCALYFTLKLLHLNTNVHRLCFASAICAAAGVICVPIIDSILRAAISVFSVFITIAIPMFGKHRPIHNYLGAVFLFLFLEAAAGGMMTVLFYTLNRTFSDLGVQLPHDNLRLRIFFLAAAILFFLLGIVSRMLSDADIRKLVQRGGTVHIGFDGREVTLPCLFDSGNLVREPISGNPVVIVPECALDILGIDGDALSCGTVKGSRLISMKTLDAESLHWGIRPEAMCLRADSIDISDAEVYLVFCGQLSEAIIPTAILQHRANRKSNDFSFERKDVSA